MDGFDLLSLSPQSQGAGIKIMHKSHFLKIPEWLQILEKVHDILEARGASRKVFLHKALTQCLTIIVLGLVTIPVHRNCVSVAAAVDV